MLTTALRITVILFYALLWAGSSLQTAMADTLAVNPDSLESLFDYSNPYRGQTFLFPTKVKADRLTVYVSPNIFKSFTFNVLLTEVEITNGLHPTRVLFESEPCDIPLGGSNDYISCTVDLGGISLTGGKTYAFILDIFDTLSRINSDSLWQYTTQTGMNSEAAYPAGDYIYFDSNCTSSSTGLPCGGREDHFAGSWIVDNTQDMAFILEYAPVPPVVPPIIELLLLKNN